MPLKDKQEAREWQRQYDATHKEQKRKYESRTAHGSWSARDLIACAVIDAVTTVVMATAVIAGFTYYIAVY